MTTTDPASLLEQRFIALETKVAYQEKLLAELNEVLVEHSRVLSDLEKRALNAERALRETLADKPAHEKPPHY